MQILHHVHKELAGQLWPPCSKVEVEDNTFSCQLAVDRQYDLTDAYTKDPHIQFLNCKTVDDLRHFTHAWGPLYLVYQPSAEEIKQGRAVRRVDECLAHLRWLRAVHNMINACKGRADWRASLAEFLAAEYDMQRTSNIYKPGDIPSINTILQQTFQFHCDPATWAASTGMGSVRRAVIFCVEANLSGLLGSLRVEPRGKGFELKPYIALPSLWDALKWMLWYDEWNRWPPRCCLECRRIFRPSSAHDVKYCSYQCAHRVTNRKWRQKDLRERKRKAAAKSKGGRNGSRKTR